MACRLPAPALLLLSLLPTPRARQAGSCSDVGENCVKTGCCKDSSMTCFLKDEEYGACMEGCAPGIHKEWDGEDATDPWHCAELKNVGCPKVNEECSQKACCFDPGTKCYRKNQNFSACLASCEPGIHEDDAGEWRTPWDCTVIERTEAEHSEVGGSATPAKGECADAFQQCGGTDWTGPTCCKLGCTCNRTSAFYHQCARADVGVGENDGSANTCEGGHVEAPYRKLNEPSRHEQPGKGKREGELQRERHGSPAPSKHVHGSDDSDGSRVLDDGDDGQGSDLAGWFSEGATADSSAERRRAAPASLAPTVACAALAAAAASALVGVVRRRRIEERLQGGDAERPLEPDASVE